MSDREQANRGAKTSARPGGRGVSVHTKIWLERHHKVVLSEWRVELLETIGRTGSLARAAEQMNVPYRTAWYKLKEIEEQLGLKLLDSESGGLGGGGSDLTSEGQEMIRRFQRVCAGIAETVDRRFRAEFGDWPD